MRHNTRTYEARKRKCSPVGFKIIRSQDMKQLETGRENLRGEANWVKVGWQRWDGGLEQQKQKVASLWRTTVAK
jgi:hypothetical protein